MADGRVLYPITFSIVSFVFIFVRFPSTHDPYFFRILVKWILLRKSCQNNCSLTLIIFTSWVLVTAWWSCSEIFIQMQKMLRLLSSGIIEMYLYIIHEFTQKIICIDGHNMQVMNWRPSVNIWTHIFPIGNNNLYTKHI